MQGAVDGPQYPASRDSSGNAQDLPLTADLALIEERVPVVKRAVLGVQWARLCAAVKQICVKKSPDPASVSDEHLTSLVDALIAVPQLRSACCSDLRHVYSRGATLKALRLVCKPLQTIMMTTVQRFTLYVDGQTANIQQQQRLFASTTSIFLKVCIVATVMPQGQAAGGTHGLHIHAFVSMLRNTIKKVISLEVNTAAIANCSLMVKTMILLSLVDGFPALLKLSILGDTGCDLLAGLGAHSPNISILEVEDVQPETLQHLATVFPRLTHGWIPAPPHDVAYAEQVPESLERLVSCPLLTELDVHQSFTPTMWRKLPCALNELHCCMTERPPRDMTQLPLLKKLIVYCITTDRVDVGAAAALLRAAPQLTYFNMRAPGVLDRDRIDCNTPHFHVQRVTSCESCMEDLVLLNKRALAGLDVFSSYETQICFHGVLVSFSNDQIRIDPQDHTPDFLASCPPFPAFVGIILENFEENSFPSFLQAFAAAFPRVNTLVINPQRHMQGVAELFQYDFIPLQACSYLEYLCVESAHLLPVQIARLCSGMKRLEQLRLFKCAAFPIEDWKTVESSLKALNCGVVIIHDASDRDDR